MERKANASELGNLDSLLDTVTDVVGILIFVLVVAMLSFRDVIARIPDGRAESQVTAADVAAAGQDRDRLISMLQALEARWPGIEATIAQGSDDLETVKTRLQELEGEILDPTSLEIEIEELLSDRQVRTEALARRTVSSRATSYLSRRLLLPSLRNEALLDNEAQIGQNPLLTSLPRPSSWRR